MIMRCLVIGCTAAWLAACGSPDVVRRDTAPADSVPSVLPAPYFTRRDSGNIRFGERIVVDLPRGMAADSTTHWFVERVTRDFQTDVRVQSGAGAEAAITLEQVTREALGTLLAAHSSIDEPAVWRDGAYVLDARGDRVTISAADDSGIFYGLTTLWQLLYLADDALLMPRMYVADTPRFAWRGLMLDSARHIQSPAFIQHYIDWMALHKLNVLHWHLTDDQAWRLEIDAYPELTRTGAWRLPAHVGDMPGVEPYGGYFTQRDVRRIVRYAANRHVTIVPEINVPGHVTAALVAYPELGVDGHAPDAVPANWGIYDNVLNLEDGTVAFFEDVLAEVIELFPSTFVHLGGDEVVTAQWLGSARTKERMTELGIADEQALQGYHFRALERYLDSHGRRAIGWDEIVESELPADAAVMSWRGTAGGIEAARAGHDVVLAPAPTLYLDHLQTDASDAPPGRWPVMTTRDVYEFNPLPPELAPYRDQVLGVQGNLWTEHVRTEDRVEYMSYPRGAAIAELGWSPATSRGWPGFVERLAGLFARYERLGLDASNAPFAVRIDARRAGTDTDTATVTLQNPSDVGRIRFTTDGTEPTAESTVYDGALELKLPVTVSARTWHDGRGIGRSRTATIDALSLLRRENRELELCSEGIALALEDDAPLDGPRASFLVDIMSPCWILRDVDTAVRGVRAAVGQLPFNFEIGDAIQQVVVHTPRTEDGELVVRAGSCDGSLAASIPLATAMGNNTVTELPEAPLEFPADTARTDLCFYFTRGGVEPIWVLDEVQLVPAPAK